MKTLVLISRGVMSALICAFTLSFSSCTLMKDPRIFATGDGTLITNLKNINEQINSIQLSMSPMQVRQILGTPELRSMMEDEKGLYIEKWSYSVLQPCDEYYDVVEYILRFEGGKLISMDSHKYIRPDKPGVFMPAPYINSTTTVSK